MPTIGFLGHAFAGRAGTAENDHIRVSIFVDQTQPRDEDLAALHADLEQDLRLLEAAARRIVDAAVGGVWPVYNLYVTVEEVARSRWRADQQHTFGWAFVAEL